MCEQVELLFNIAILGKKSSGKSSFIKFASDQYHAPISNIIIKALAKSYIYNITLHDDIINDLTSLVIILCDPYDMPSYSDIIFTMAQNYNLKIPYCMMVTKMDLVAHDKNFNFDDLEKIAKLFPHSNLFSVSIFEPECSFTSIEDTMEKIANMCVDKYLDSVGVRNFYESSEA